MKTIIISDALNGFGLDLASDLARLGYFIIAVAPNSKESENIKKSIKHRYIHSQVETFVGNFSNIKNVRQILLNIKLIMTNYNLTSIYAYIGNNQIFETRMEKNDNEIENQFFQNYLSHFIMSCSLLPYMQKEKNSKIILPALSNRDMGILNFKDLFYEKKYDGVEAFKSAKLANTIIAGELNRRYNQGDNPVETVLYQEKIVTSPETLNAEPELKGLKKLFNSGDRLYKVYKGIEAILNISSHEEKLFFKFSKSSKLPSICENKELGAKLFELSEKMGRLKYS